MKHYKKYSQEDLNTAFIEACEGGDLKIVQHLLTSPKLSKHANMHVGYDAGFRLACSKGQLDVVKYLLTSPDLADIGYPDVHAESDYPVIWAANTGRLNVVTYLIFEYGVPMTEHIAEFCSQQPIYPDQIPNDLVAKMFETRTNYNNLNQSVPLKNSTKIHKNKI